MPLYSPILPCSFSLHIPHKKSMAEAVALSITRSMRCLILVLIQGVAKHLSVGNTLRLDPNA